MKEEQVSICLPTALLKRAEKAAARFSPDSMPAALGVTGLP